MITVENLDIAFGSGRGRVHAVRQVSFKVARGESFGLVGESGSGKSTVLRAIAGLTPGWRGAMAVDGVALGQKRARDFHRRLQMVFQDPYGSLHPRHTVNDILKEPLIIHKVDDIEFRVLKALDEVGLGAGYRFRFPHQLSGGQRQRIAIARALILDPEVILLDEPTSGLDVEATAKVESLLHERIGEGVALIVVTHDGGQASRLAARRLSIEKGVLRALNGAGGAS